MKYSTLLLEKVGAIVLLKLNLPEALNPMSHEMSREFPQAIEEIRRDPEIKGLILTGNGQAFSAGGNLKIMQQRTKIPPFRHKEEVRQFYRSFLTIRSLTIPTIAAVNGYAIGAGACLVLDLGIHLNARVEQGHLLHRTCDDDGPLVGATDEVLVLLPPARNPGRHIGQELIR